MTEYPHDRRSHLAFSLSILLATFSAIPVSASSPAGSPTQAVPSRFSVFRLPDGTSPYSIAIDPNGRIYFSDPKANRIVAFNPVDASLRPFTIPTRDSRPGDLVSGPDSSLTFTETRGGKIGRLDPSSGVIHEYPAPDGADDPSMLALGTSGSIFFTCPSADLIGALDPPSGQFSLFAVPTPGSAPDGIASGPIGSLFFTEPAAGKIGRFDLTTHAIEEFATPTSDSRPLRLVFDGVHVFFTEFRSGKLGRFSPPDKTFKEWNSPDGPSSRPEAIAIDHSGVIWYCESVRSTLVRFDPRDESTSQMPLPHGASSVHSMETAPDGRLWMALDGIDALAALTP